MESCAVTSFVHSACLVPLQSAATVAIRTAFTDLDQGHILRKIKYCTFREQSFTGVWGAEPLLKSRDIASVKGQRRLPPL